MKKEMNTFEEIGNIAFAYEKSENKSLLFLETIKDAIKAARGEDVPAESKQRFEVLFPFVESAIDQAMKTGSAKKTKAVSRAERLAFQVDTLLDYMGGSSAIDSSLDEIFRDYLSMSEGRDGAELSQTYEMITQIKMIFG